MYPVLFQIWWIEFYSNAVIIFIWMIFSSLFLIKRIKKNNLSLNFLNDYFFILIFSFLFFWRIWEVFLKSSVYLLKPLEIFYFWDSNFSFFLWILWMWLVFSFLTIIKKENFLKWIDAIFPVFLIWMLFISFWDFLSWESYWLPTSSLVWVIFNSPNIKYTLPIHPVQIYEFLWVSLILFIIFIIWRKKRLSWVLSSFWFFLFFLLEFILEFFRAWIDKIFFWYGFNQILFWILSMMCLIFFILRSHKNIDIYNYKMTF